MPPTLRSPFLVGLLLSSTGLGLAAEATAQEDPAQLIERVTAIFEASCAPCHNPDAELPGAAEAWDGARDLRATAANRLLVTPGDPEQSLLYREVEEGSMPPGGVGIPPLTEEERADLAAWIADVTLLSEEVLGAAAPESTVGVGGTTTPPRGWSLGRMHTPLVAFPIVLLVAALIADLLRRRRAAHFCLGLGTLSAFLAAAVGRAAASWIGATGTTFLAHAVLGVAAAVLALVTLIFYAGSAKEEPATPVAVRWLMVVTVVAVLATGYWGGKLG